MSDMIGQLFPDVSAERITTFSCGHIVPEENLQALVVSKSPRGNDVEYKADKQGDPEVASQKQGFFLFRIDIDLFGVDDRVGTDFAEFD